MDPVKVFGDDPCFIALQVSDEVPGEVEIRQRLDLFDAFLDEVLAECALPGSGGLADLLQGLLLANREQADVGRVPARLDRRDYLNRWREILEIETEEYKQQLAVFKMAQMNLGRSAILVAGGAYGNIPAHNNPAVRPRRLPSWVR